MTWNRRWTAAAATASGGGIRRCSNMAAKLSTQPNPNANPNPNSKNSNSTSNTDSNKWSQAILVLQKPQILDWPAYRYLLHGCIRRKRRAQTQGLLIHAHMLQTGFFFFFFFCNSAPIIFNALLRMYLECLGIDSGRRLFDSESNSRVRDVCSWSQMIAAYARHGPAAEALILFHRMKNLALTPNMFTFSSVLCACSALRDAETGIRVHEEISASLFEADAVVRNALINMYVKCGLLACARQVFDEMPHRTLVSWNAMIAGYAQQGALDEAFELWMRMPVRDLVSWNVMIDGFAQNGLLDKALILFDRAPKRDNVAWNSLISGYCDNGCVSEALRLFERMRTPNVVSWNAMLAGFCWNGHVNQAFLFFQKVPWKNLVTWTTMISGFQHHGHSEEALKLFRDMELSGLRPDSPILAIVVSACASLAALQKGMEIHGKVIKGGFESHLVLCNSLIDMYARCGCCDKAREQFDSMPNLSVVSWTAMITGYAVNGYGKAALDTFWQMLNSGIKPTETTMVSVLTACSYAGFVDEGWFYFNRMGTHYQMTPSIDHYRCMVYLFCRAGRIQEAYDLIARMPMMPDSSVWSSLLGICNIHDRAKLSERAEMHDLNLIL